MTDSLCGKTACSRKSERLEKQTPLMTSVESKSAKRNRQSPFRRSERGKKDISSGSSDSRNVGESSKSFEANRKKIQQGTSLNMSNVEEAKDVIRGPKRKRMDARRYRALFRTQKMKETLTDDLRRMDAPSDTDCAASQVSSSRLMEPEEEGDRCMRELDNDAEDGCLEIFEDGAGKLVSSSRTSVSNISRDVCKAELLNSRSRGSVTEKSCEHSVPSDVDGETLPDNTCFIAEVSQELEIAPSIGFNALEKGHQSINSKIPDPSCDVGGVSPSFSQRSSSAQERYHCFVGTCGKCSKESRLKHDSPEQELCSCNLKSVKHIDDTSCLNGMDPEANAMLRSAEKLWSCDKTVGDPGDPQMGSDAKVCYVCLKDGNLVFCHGMVCLNGCHISCLDPPLADVLSVAWHCIGCVKKKIGSGVHSVSKGVEEIWDSREVMISNTKGKYLQKQYLVKYYGLAHVHNHWVPETMLLSQISHHVDRFIQKQQQGLRWNSDWTVPHRLLKKRPLKFPEQQASSRADSTTFFCQYEWLVKWCNLGYEHASWELEDAYFLQSSLGEKLVREYEQRKERMERVVHKSCEGSSVEMTNLPSGGSTVADCIVLNVNKLQEFWYKEQNAVVFDDQDRVVSSIIFVMSLANTGHPFLVIANTDAISHWETEFMRVAPSVDIVVYDGNEETRRSIRSLEFYGKRSRVIPQVLLASSEAALQDVHFLKDIRWGAIIIDQLDTGVSTHLEQMRMLTTNSRVILFVSQRKDRVTDYLGLLSLLECHDSSKGGDGKCENNIIKFKEQLSRYIAYGCIAEPSKFVEYWVPAQISNLQLEQYCATLLLNSSCLCSCSKNDHVGALREILSTIRKCCDHPYLVDSELQGSITKGLQLPEVLDVGIKASGKLQRLDMILSEIKARQLRVLILFQKQPIKGSGISIGDILDDFVCERFGQHSYERVDAHVSTKQASLKRFNMKDSGQFVFLLEKGACLPSIKLASVDTVIVFDSDWNPGNDLRALQRISISSQFSQIKVFRLYLAFTIEEKALILAKQGIYLDNNLQNISRINTDTLLSWGASNLFNRLEEFHSRKSRTMLTDIPFEDLHANDVLREFQVTLTAESEAMDPKKFIPKAKQLKGVYCTNFPLLDEIKIQSLLGEEPHIFWKNLLEGRNPCWRYPCLMTRNRKRVQYFDGSSKKPEMESDDLIKKRRKVVDNALNPCRGDEPAAAHGTGHANHSLQLPDIGGGASSPSPASSNSHDNISLPERMQHQSGEKLLSDEQTSIHIYLGAEMEKLCELLSLKEDMKHVLHAFMGYVVENHRVSKENVTIFQALQISLCWVAASMLKKKIDRGYSLMLAKKKLKFECSVEEADYVYKKLRMLKKTFLQQPSIMKEWQALINPTSTEEHVLKDTLDVKTPESVHLRSESQQTVNEENLTDVEHVPEDQGCNLESETTSMLREKQQEEIDEFHKVWEEKWLLLEKKNSVAAGIIRLIHHNSVVRMEKLKMLDTEFSRKVEEHKKLMEAGLKDLKGKHLAALNEEREEKDQWLAKCCGRENRTSGAAVSDLTVVAVRCTTPTDSDHLQDELVNDLQASNGFQSGVPVCSMVDVVAIDIPCGTTFTLNETDNSLHSNQNTLLDISVNAVNEEERCALPMEIGSVHGAPTCGKIKFIVPETTSIPRDEEDNDVSSNAKRPMSGEPHSKQSPNCKVVDSNHNTLLDISVDAVNEGERCAVPMEIGSVHGAPTCGKIKFIVPETSIPRDEEDNDVSSNAKRPMSGEPHSKQSPNCNVVDSNHITLLDISVDGVNEGERCAVPMEIGSVHGAPTCGKIKFIVPETTSIPRDEEDNDVSSNAKRPMSGEPHSKQSPNCNVVDHSYVCKGIDSAKTVTNAESHDEPFPDEANESVPADMHEEAHEVLTSINDPDMHKTDIQSNEADAAEDRVGCSGAHDLMANQMDDASGTDHSSDQASLLGHPDEEIDPVDHTVSAPRLDDASGTDHSSDQASLLGHPDEEIDPVDHTVSAPRQATADELPQRSMATAVQGEDQQDHVYLSNIVESTESENMPQLTTYNLTGEAGTFSGAADNGLTAETVGPESRSSTCQNFSDGCTSLQPPETTHQVEEPPNHSQHQPRDIENSGLSSASIIENPNIVINIHSLPPVNNGEPASRFCESLQTVGQPSVVEDSSSQRINRAVQQAANQLGLSDFHSSLQADPLQIELEKLRKELEQTTKGHENLRSQLRANCEKEIAQVVAEIRKKYEAKFQDAETIFQLKKKSLDTNVNKVFLNKLLADAVSTKCIDVRPSARPAGVLRQQGLMQQQLQQIPLQPTSGPSAGSSPPGVTPASQKNTSLILPAEPRSATLSAGVSSCRPPIISSISSPQTNARVGGDVRAAAPRLQSVRADVRAAAPHLQHVGVENRAAAPHLQPVGVENRAAAPHLQPFRPPVSVTGPTHSSLSHSMTTQQFPANQVLPVSSQALLPRSQTAGSPISPSESQSAGAASYNSTHPSALELLRDIDRRFKAVLPNTALSPVVSDSNVHRVEGGSASSVIPTDVVCLSDDE